MIDPFRINDPDGTPIGQQAINEVASDKTSATRHNIQTDQHSANAPKTPN
jgi:hypothetical protein